MCLCVSVCVLACVHASALFAGTKKFEKCTLFCACVCLCVCVYCIPSKDCHSSDIYVIYRFSISFTRKDALSWFLYEM